VPARRSARAQGVGFVQLGVGIVVHGFGLDQPSYVARFSFIVAQNPMVS